MTLTFVDAPLFSGVAYCAASSVNASSVYTTSTIQSYLVREATQTAYLPRDLSATVTITSLTPLSTYFVYCSVQNSLGLSTPGSTVLAQGFSTTTACCKTISFSSAPAFIYANATATQLAASVPVYSLDYLPRTNITVSPSFFVLRNGSYVSTSSVRASPSKATFSSSSQVSWSSFLIIASVSGTYRLQLSVSGDSSSQYSVTSTKTFSVVSTENTPAPSLASAIFSSGGGSVFITFDSSTNQASLSTGSTWKCNSLFSFTGASLSSCSWLNNTVVQVSFPASSSATLLEVGNAVTIYAGVLKPYCASSATSCSVSNNSRQSVYVTAPSNAITPSVSLPLPSSISTCANLSVDATGSSGAGGRAWKNVTWSVVRNDGTASVLATAFSKYNGVNTLKAFSVPRSYLDVGIQFVTLTLTNFLGRRSSRTVTVEIVSSADLPVISIAGPASISMVPSSSLSLVASSRASSCSSSTTSLVYAWSVYKDGAAMTSLKSTSRNALTFSLNAFALNSSSIYTVQFSANSSSASVSTQVTVVVKTGAVKAVIAGSSARLISSDVTLDASSSVDESFASNRYLQFSWLCTIASTDAFGDDCTSSLLGSSAPSGSRLLIRYAVANASTSYTINLQATSSLSGSSSVATVTLTTPAADMPSVNLSTSTAPSYSNSDSQLSLSATVQSTSSLDCQWVASVGDVTYSVNVSLAPLNRSLSASQASSAVAVPLVVSSSLFPPGAYITFTLYVQALSTSTTASSNRLLQISTDSLAAYAAVTVYINAPPSLGVTTVDPQNGTALTTSFQVSTDSWTDDVGDLPFTYEFLYQVSKLVSPLTLQSRKPVNSVSSYLPAGSASSHRAVKVVGRAYDIYGASSTANYTCYVDAISADADLSGFLSDQLSLAGVAGDPDLYLSTVNLVASTINTNDCSNASTVYCASLNRENCDATPNTCGSCLEGYSGAYGDFNLPCTATTSSNSTSGRRLLSSVGEACSSNADCLYDLCSSDLVCAEPSKTCPSSCSSQGSCLYYIGSAEVSSTDCLVTNTLCSARCSCDEGFGGIDCSLLNSTLQTRTAVRGLMCNALQSVVTSSDASQEITSSLAVSLHSAYSSSEVVSVSAQNICADTLTQVVSASSGVVSTSSVEAVDNLLGVMSSFLRTSSAEVAANATTALASNVLAGTVDGITSAEFTSTELKLSFSTMSVLDLLQASTIEVPRTAAEVYYDSAVPQIVLNNDSAYACEAQNGFISMSVGAWSSSPYTSSSTLQSALLRTQSSSLRTSSNTASDAANGYVNATVAYYLVLPFNIKQTLQTRSEAIASGSYNVTLPTCTQTDEAEDGGSTSYAECGNCTLSTYDNTTATFACYDISNVCAGYGSLSSSSSVSSLSSSRLLSTTDDASDDATASEQALATLYQTAALLKAVRAEVNSVLSANPFDINLNNAKPILATVSVLLLLVILGLLIFERMDSNDRVYLLYAKRFKNIKSLERMNSDIDALGLPQGASSDEVGDLGDITNNNCSSKSDVSTISNINRSISHSNSHSMYHFTLPQNSFSYKQTERLHKQHQRVYKEQFQSVLDAAIPIRSILDTPFGSLLRFLRVLARKHELTMMFSYRSLRRTRILRWFAVSNKILLMIFIDTIIFSIFFPDTGVCEALATEADCLAPFNNAVQQSQCVWSTSSSASSSSTEEVYACSLRPPPSTVTFNIALSLVTLLLQMPLTVLFVLLRTQICCRMPQLSWQLFPVPADTILRDLDAENDDDAARQGSGMHLMMMKTKRKINDLGRSDNRLTSSSASSSASSKNAVYYDKETYYDTIVNDREANFVSEMHYLTAGSAREEATGLLHALVTFFTQTSSATTSSASPSTSAATPSASAPRVEARLAYIERALGFHSDARISTPFPTSLLCAPRRHYSSSTPLQRLTQVIVDTRNRTSILMDRFYDLEYSDAFSKNLLLLQYLVTDQFNLVERFVMKFQFFEYSLFPPGDVNLVVWLAGWLVLIGAQLFFVYWTFAWAVSSGGRTFRAWGTNTGIAFAQDVLFVQIFNIYVIYIAGMQLVLPKMRAIYAYLKNLMIRIKHHNAQSQQVLSEFRLCQYLLSSCRIARRKRLRGLQAARMLFYLDDFDVERFRATTKLTRIAISVSILVLFPSLLSALNEVVGDLCFQLLSPVLFSSLALLLYYLISFAVIAFVLVLFALVFGFVALNSDRIVCRLSSSSSSSVDGSDGAADGVEGVCQVLVRAVHAISCGLLSARSAASPSSRPRPSHPNEAENEEGQEAQLSHVQREYLQRRKSLRQNSRWGRVWNYVIKRCFGIDRDPHRARGRRQEVLWQRANMPSALHPLETPLEGEDEEGESEGVGSFSSEDCSGGEAESRWRPLAVYASQLLRLQQTCHLEDDVDSDKLFASALKRTFDHLPAEIQSHSLFHAFLHPTSSNTPSASSTSSSTPSSSAKHLLFEDRHMDARSRLRLRQLRRRIRRSSRVEGVHVDWGEDHLLSLSRPRRLWSSSFPRASDAEDAHADPAGASDDAVDGAGARRWREQCGRIRERLRSMRLNRSSSSSSSSSSLSVSVSPCSPLQGTRGDATEVRGADAGRVTVRTALHLSSNADAHIHALAHAPADRDGDADADADGCAGEGKREDGEEGGERVGVCASEESEEGQAEVRWVPSERFDADSEWTEVFSQQSPQRTQTPLQTESEEEDKEVHYAAHYLASTSSHPSSQDNPLRSLRKTKARATVSPGAPSNTASS